jgi:5S rRNA maturation endonuclease (ribonuclease M5)
LSWLSDRELAEPDCGVIILHSVALKRRALDAISAHGFGRVLLFLDHDQAGRETTRFFTEQLGNRNVVDRSNDYAGFKDLNDWRRAKRPG